MTDTLEIYPDEVRGHIAYRQSEAGQDRSGRREINATDLGRCLHFGGGWLMLTPDQARRVADSLHWWADRHPDTPPVEVPDGQGLFEFGDAS